MEVDKNQVAQAFQAVPAVPAAPVLGLAARRRVVIRPLVPLNNVFPRDLPPAHRQNPPGPVEFAAGFEAAINNPHGF